jgi:hypothetical protein
MYNTHKKLSGRLNDPAFHEMLDHVMESERMPRFYWPNEIPIPRNQGTQTQKPNTRLPRRHRNRQ